ncbi:MAG TPA: hypothetical protein G4N94_11490 [Caldilineae bacterium]|nr:hypothetical protein [Caldilineae bacterium]
MTPNAEKRNTFVLRIWREEEDGREQDAWRGWIQHVRSGKEVYVQDLLSLIHFVEQRTGRLTDRSHSPTRLK